jgi:hypothetical protein
MGLSLDACESYHKMMFSESHILCHLCGMLYLSKIIQTSQSSQLCLKFIYDEIKFESWQLGCVTILPFIYFIVTFYKTTTWAYLCIASVPPPPIFIFSSLSFSLSLAPMFLATLLASLIWQRWLRRRKILNIVLTIVWGQARLLYR